MEEKNRTRCVLLGLLCLTPALFFWVMYSLPVETEVQPMLLYFGGTTLLELIICGFVFPLIALALGWNAYRRCESKTESILVIGVGLMELIASVIALFLGVGF